MLLHMIAAVSRQTGAIGFNGHIPWHKPADLRAFRQLTDNSSIIVGSRTAETLPNLPNREVYIWDGRKSPEIFLDEMDRVGIRASWLCGGAYTYEMFAPFVNGLRIISYIDYENAFDTVFPFKAYGLPELMTLVEGPAW